MQEINQTIGTKNVTSYEEAFRKSKEYFGGDELAATTYLGKYALKNEKGEILEPTPDLMHRRLAKEFARIEAKYPNPMSEDEIFALFDKFRYVIPQGSPMAGIGNPYQTMSLSNCFVVEVGDSYGWIMKADQELAHIYRRRGGCGLDISAIRPKDSKTKNAAGTSTGIGPFMERFSNTTREVGQCIAAGQRVLTQRGLVEIENVRPNIDKVWTKTGWVTVCNVVANGTKEVFQTTTNFGYSIETTLNHVFVSGENKETVLSDFESGDEICLLPGVKLDTLSLVNLKQITLKENFGTRTNYSINLPKVLDENFAYLIGYAYGDGSIEYNKLGYPQSLCLACSNDYPEIKEKLAKSCKETFGYEITKRKGDGDLERLSINSVVIMQFLEENNLLKQKSADIQMPKAIWNSPSMVQMAFLSGYFDADGYASGKKKGYVFTSISRSFLGDVQTILLANGIVSKIHAESREENGWNTLFSLCVVGKSAQQVFVEYTQNMCIKTQRSMHISKRDCLVTPYNIKEFQIKQNNYSYISSDSNISVSAYQRYVIESERFNLPKALVKDSIREIKSVGIKETYDLVLESEHLFWCEGFYVHNSGRRGANMQSISIHHPEIETFINIKRDLKKVTGSNISIRISDEFMKAVKANQTYEQRWPVDSKSPTISNKVPAKKIWDQIIAGARDSAEPGLLFWDTILKESPADCYKQFGFETKSTNPCSELPLAVGDSCRLIVINLMCAIQNPFESNSKIDYKKLYNITYKAQRLIDDLIDLEIESIDKIITKINSDPEPEEVKVIELKLWESIKEKCVNGRRTGLGPTALGDALAAVGLVYGSEESISVVEEIFKTIAIASYESSIDMAKERGQFPVFSYDLEKENPFLQRVLSTSDELRKKYEQYGRRNIANLTTAPCGSISLLAELIPGHHQTTSGIECAYLTSYKRRKKINPNDKDATVDFVDELGDKWQEFTIYHPGYKVWLEKNNKTEKDFNESPYYKGTALEVNWIDGTKLQSAAQKWVDHSISRTQNLPSDVSYETVSEIYMNAYDSGCKGYTVYRDGSRSGVLVSNDTKPTNNNKFDENHAPKRPTELVCDVYQTTVGGEKWTIFVSLMNDKPYEVMGGLAKHIKLPKKTKSGKISKMTMEDGTSQYNFHYDFENPDDETIIQNIGNIFENQTNAAFSRVISLSLRHGTPVQYVVEQLVKGSDKDSDLFSFSKVMSRVLKNYIKDGTKPTQKKCTNCGSDKLIYKEGCSQCLDCGDSKCS